MPSLSGAQQMAMAIAEHNPGSLYKRNQGLLNMSHQQLHDFAATSRTNLPYHKYNLIPTAIKMRGRKSKLTPPPGGRGLTPKIQKPKNP